MLNGDKAHIYQVLDHAKCKLLADQKSLSGENVARPGDDPDGSLIMEARNLHSQHVAAILHSMNLFRCALENEIEAHEESSFDSVLMEVEKKCIEWKSQL